MGVDRSKMKIFLEAPILTQSGYGEHSRLVYESIRDKGYDIYINPLAWGTTTWANDTNRAEIEQLIDKYKTYAAQSEKTKQQLDFDVQIHVGIPNEFQKKARYSICVTAGIETDRVSSNWLLKTHEGIDKLIVPSEHSKSGFMNTAYEVINNQTKERQILQCNCPVDVVPYPVKDLKTINLDLDVETKFNFLTVALLGPRKNIENTVKWFLQEFKNDPDVGLIVKTAFSKGSLIDRGNTLKHIKRVISEAGESECKVYLLHGNMTPEEIHSLYVSPKVNAYICASHGEGYGLPIFEAAYSGMPVVATDWSAHLDFLTAPYKESGKVRNKKLFARVSCDIAEVPKKAVWENIIIEGAQWAYPSEISFKQQIRKVKNNYGMYKKWATKLQEHVLQTHKKKDILQKMHDAIIPQNYKHSEDKKSTVDEIEEIFASLSQGLE